MANEEKAKEIAAGTVIDGKIITYSRIMYDAALTMAAWKDEQPIKESGGWHTEQPTEDGWYLVDTPDFPKNCHFVVAEWDNDAKNFYDEHSDYPIKFIGWKLIERR